MRLSSLFCIGWRIRRYNFDIRLILTEVLTNAFKHGNKSDESKPIYLRCKFNIKGIEFEVEDSGEGFEFRCFTEEEIEENILNNSGRGLFLVKSMAEEVKVNKNVVNIKMQVA